MKANLRDGVHGVLKKTKVRRAVEVASVRTCPTAKNQKPASQRTLGLRSPGGTKGGSNTERVDVGVPGMPAPSAHPKSLLRAQAEAQVQQSPGSENHCCRRCPSTAWYNMGNVQVVESVGKIHVEWAHE
eukprot:6086718-Amphidinium_carterae.1